MHYASAFVLFATTGKESNEYKRYLRDKGERPTHYLALEPPGVVTTLSLDGGLHTKSVPSPSVRVGDRFRLERTRECSPTLFYREPLIQAELAS
jgi:hypothetical protein